MGLVSEEHPLNPQAFMKSKKPDVSGIITLLNSTEYAEWWIEPNIHGDYKPQGRPAPTYEAIGKALDATKYKAVTPLCEITHPNANLKDRFVRAAYALYDKDDIEKLKKVIE